MARRSRSRVIERAGHVLGSKGKWKPTCLSVSFHTVWDPSPGRFQVSSGNEVKRPMLTIKMNHPMLCDLYTILDENTSAFLASGKPNVPEHLVYTHSLALWTQRNDQTPSLLGPACSPARKQMTDPLLQWGCMGEPSWWDAGKGGGARAKSTVWNQRPRDSHPTVGIMVCDIWHQQLSECPLTQVIPLERESKLHKEVSLWNLCSFQRIVLKISWRGSGAKSRRQKSLLAQAHTLHIW